MKVLNVIPSLEIKAGGPTQSTYLLTNELRKNHTDVEIVTVDNLKNEVIGRDDYIHYIPESQKTYFSFLRSLDRFSPDLLHVQSLWHPIAHAGVAYASKKGIPYIISTRGMLYPSALRVSCCKKFIAWNLYQKYDLNHAAVVHATCMQEMRYNRAKGVKVPIAVIPNAIFASENVLKSSYTGKKRIGFLGRFHPIKNLDILIKAWALANTKEWELVLVGSGTEKYVSFLKSLAIAQNVTNICFAGFLQGEAKRQMLATFQYLVLPSQSENFGMVVPEALIQSVPVIASKGTPWEELNTHRCGWWVDNDVDALATTIQEALNISEEERLVMGELGKRLVKDNYSVEIVAGKMKRLYEWILYGGEKPEFVYLK